MRASQYEFLTAERLVALKNAGAAPMEAIKTLHQEFDLSLAEAKQALARSPAWTVEAAAGDVLHAQITQSGSSIAAHTTRAGI